MTDKPDDKFEKLHDELIKQIGAVLFNFPFEKLDYTDVCKDCFILDAMWDAVRRVTLINYEHHPEIYPDLLFQFIHEITSDMGIMIDFKNVITSKGTENIH